MPYVRKCTRCPRPARPGMTRCDACAARQATYNARSREAHRDQARRRYQIRQALRGKPVTPIEHRCRGCGSTGHNVRTCMTSQVAA